jgi:hypothetical protein
VSTASYSINCIGEPNVNGGNQKRIPPAEKTIFLTPPRVWG